MRGAFPALTGMLVVSKVLPGSPSSGVLQPGDILLRVNGRYVTQFEPLEALLDDNVGGTVELSLERGGKSVTANSRSRICMRSRRTRTCSSATAWSTPCHTNWPGSSMCR